ncbi:hypothetical protein Aperf_G00000078984 [Anoplocephala perfoliata]
MQLKGAGQDVGRSCILVSAEGKNIMLDCGMHMGFQDEEDYRRLIDKRSDLTLFSSEMIDRCMKKVRCVDLHQVVKVDEKIEIQAFYAGHVLGAAMFLIKIGENSILYTGDYNMTPDRHLGSAWVPRCRPDLLITETTYATTIRDSKRAREREFLEKIHACLDDGGKVLIPVFALGRVQELSILLETYWERMNLSYPIYFSHGMAEKATALYKLFISWTNQKIKETFVERNLFDFKHIELLQQDVTDQPVPMVVFATPGMLHGGQSLAIFRKWAPDPKNMVIIPGFCVSGTVGYKVLNGVKQLEFDKKTVDVRLRVEYLSFSAHADARGIMQLISQCRPGHVLLVHGESGKMDFLRKRIEEETGLPCSMPANGEITLIHPRPQYGVMAPAEMVKSFIDENSIIRKGKKTDIFRGGIVANGCETDGVLLTREEALKCVGLREHTMLFTSIHAFVSTESIATLVKRASTLCLGLAQKASIEVDSAGMVISKAIAIDIEKGDSKNFILRVTYSLKDEELGAKMFTKLKDALPRG